MKNLIIRALSGAVYVALIVTALYFHVVFYVLFLFFSLTGVYEYSKMTCAKDDKPIIAYWIVLAALFFTALFWSYAHNIFRAILYVISGIVLVGLPIFELFRHKPFLVANIANGFLAMMWIVLPLALLGFWTQVASPNVVLAFLILTWSMDTFAYLGGILFGKHKLCQRISPNKTWEGLIIGWLLTTGISVALFFIPYFRKAVPQFHVWHWILFATLILLFGTCGDLIESMFKRSAGLKDSGNLLPGHGGILDRLDSILIAIYPAMLFYLFFAGGLPCFQ